MTFSLIYAKQSAYLEAWKYLIRVSSDFTCNPVSLEIILDCTDYELEEEFDEDVARLKKFNK